jgi:hypothetical protein
LRVRLGLELLSPDVEARLLAGARERDVPPFLQPACIGAEDERALDGEPLARVPGEGVGVADVAALEVAAVEADLVPAVSADVEAAAGAVDLLDRPPGAVANAEGVRVAQADDPVAGSKLAACDFEALAPEPPLRVQEHAGDRVQLGDVAAAVGDHDAPRQVQARCSPPVGEEARAQGERIGGDDESPSVLGEGEILASDPAADGLERLPLEPVALAAVVRKLELALALDDGGEEPARADGGELLRVADEDRLPLRLLDEGEDAGEDARLRHPRLVDDEHAPPRETVVPLGVEQEAVEGGA